MVAKTLDIELINPYCGLPLCVGWDDALDVSVEAIEATITATAQGLNNHGNKSHGRPCFDCVLRNRCGGAWHAVWSDRLGRGIAPPDVVHMPWEGTHTALQVVFEHLGNNVPIDWKAIAMSMAPSKWLWIDQPTAIGHIRAAGIGHLVLRIRMERIEDSKPMYKLARRIAKGNAIVSPQRVVQVHLEWPVPRTATVQSIEAGFALASALGAYSLTLTGPHAEPFHTRIDKIPRSIVGRVFAG